MQLSLSTVAKILNATWCGVDRLATGISTDSRSICQGDIFIALIGDNFDGHEFISQAKNRGAIASIVSKPGCSEPIIQVDDTLKALALLAQDWHQQCETLTLAVTGSVGKTTVKEMLAAMIKPQAECCVTAGNFNNKIGLPLTLLNETNEHQFSIIEMGANAKNEIAQLSEIANPEVGIITEIAAAHLEGFGSLKKIAQAKSELFRSLPDEGVAIFNINSPHQDILLAASSHCKQIKVSLHKQVGADIWAEDIQPLKDGWSFNFSSKDNFFKVKLNLHGKHNIVNALLAIAGVKALGLNISVFSNRLETLSVVPGRLEVHEISNLITLFDDSYNANPASMKAGIELLSEQSGESLLVMGDMGELGDDEIQLHHEMGLYARDKKLTKLFAVGTLSSHAVKSFGEKGELFNNKQALIKKIQYEIERDLSFSGKKKLNILVKGSRFAKMEQVVQAILKNYKKNSINHKSSSIDNEFISQSNNKKKQEQI